MAANTIMKLLVSLGVDVGEFKQGLAGAEGAATNSAAKISQSFQQVGKAMMGIGAGMTAALSVPIAMFLVDAVKEAGEAEVSLAMVENTIRATGGAAGVTAEECKKFADSMSLLTGFTDDAIMESQNLLLTFTAIGKDIFPRASRATLDLARQFKMDLGSASIMVGKALQDPIMGLTAMRRVGVSMTEQQMEMVKSMMAVGDIAGAQGIIFEVLEGQVAGAAEAYGETFPGQVDKLKRSFDNLKESLGKQLIPVLQDLMKIIQPVIQALADAPPWVQDLILVFLGLVFIAGPIVTILGAILLGIGMLFSPGTLAGLATVASVITGTLIPAIVAIGTAIWGALLPLLPVLALLGAAIVLIYMLWKNWDELGVIISQLWFIIKTAFIQGFEEIKNKIEELKNGFILLHEDGSGLLLDLAQAFGFPKQAAQDLLSAIWALISPDSGLVKLYEDGSGALLDLAVAFGFPKQIAQEFLRTVWSIIDGFPLIFEDGSGALLNLAQAFGLPKQAVQDFLATVWGVFSPDSNIGIPQMVGNAVMFIQTTWNNAINSIQSFFTNAFTNVSNFFTSVKDSIIAGINAIISAVQNLISWLSGIEIPSPLMPGSPTPFEMGLRGIADAMRELTSFNPINIGMPGLSGFAPMTPAPATSGAVNNINITVGEIKNRNDMDYLAQEILRRITKA